MIVTAVIAAAWAGWWLAERRAAIQGETLVRVDTITRTDTIIARTPAARDCALVRYVTVRVPVRVPVAHADTSTDGQAGTREDAAEAVLPITQARYTDDSTYTAWVSGYSPALDSIHVYPRHEVVTITNTVRRKPKRWDVGIHAGYGMTPKGFQPYVGVGVSWRIW